MVTMKITRRLGQLALMIMFVITGIISCETFGPKYNTARHIIAPIADEKARIIVYRPSSFFWYGYKERPDIFLNNHKVGISRPGTVFYVDVEPGSYRVTIPAAIYAGHVSTLVVIHRGETVYVRNNVGASVFVGKMKVEVVSPEQAINEIDGLEFMLNPME